MMLGNSRYQKRGLGGIPELLRFPAMDADDADLRNLEGLVREKVEQSEGPVASVTCTRDKGAGAHCEVVLVDGRTAVCAANLQERRFAYFVRPRPADVMEPTDLIFMPDYGADPVWTADRNSMVSL